MQSRWALQSQKHANPLICWEPGLWLSPSLMEHTWGAPPIATTTFQNLIWGGQSLVFPLPLGCEGALSCRKQAIADHHAFTPRIHTSWEFLEDPGAGGALELPQTRT